MYDDVHEGSWSYKLLSSEAVDTVVARRVVMLDKHWIRQVA